MREGNVVKFIEFFYLKFYQNFAMFLKNFATFRK